MTYQYCIDAVSTMFKNLAIYQWRDVMEVLLLSIAFYRITCWLKKDKHKKLLECFYLYSISILLSHFAHLEIVTGLLFIGTPVVAMLFILAHEKNLQANFITIKRAYTNAQKDWVTELVQTTLVAMNKNKSLICVIERGESIEDFVETPCRADSLINQYFLTTLIESPVYEDEKLLWCNQKGRLVSYNASWKKHDAHAWVSDDIDQEHHWKQHALFYSTKFDCIVFKLQSAQRTFDLIIDGSIAENLSAVQLAHILSLSCNVQKKSSPPAELKDCHGIDFKKPYQKQQLL